MKITGGTFGMGSAEFNKRGDILVSGATEFVIRKSEALSAFQRSEKELKFGAVGFLIGSIVLGIILGLAFGVVGALIGVVFAIAGSFHNKTTHHVELRLTDDRVMVLTGRKSDVEKVVAFAAR
ncbi:MAG TPA: hypothetical protein PKH39_18560 [Woeseiaceae bacterium]|nr:hypothetical protein [Woeseiaceae bacterium]